jgi:uncharacterized protein YcbK (DUF882 family)
MITIHRGDKQQITTNFTLDEFFTKAPGVESHELDERLITAAQFVRSYYGVPVTINSTFRPDWYNSSIGGVKGSQHTLSRAIDFTIKSSQARADYCHDIATQGPVSKALRQIGIGGFGLYDSFAHIDTRNYSALWDNRKKKIIYQDDEDGLQITTGGKWLFISIVTVIIVLVVYIKNK